MVYRLTQQAREDIIGISVDGVSAFGVRQAEAYHAMVERAFRTLCENPRMARERTEISPPVRVHPCGSHIVVLLIVRVRHGREDWIDNPVGSPP